MIDLAAVEGKKFRPEKEIQRGASAGLLVGGGGKFGAGAHI